LLRRIKKGLVQKKIINQLFRKKIGSTKMNQLFRKKYCFNKNASVGNKKCFKTLPAAAGAFVLERRQDFGLLRGRSFQRIGVQPGVWGGGREEKERRKKSMSVSV